MLEGLALDCDREQAHLVAFIQDHLADAGYGRAVLGLSGGIDSALVATLSAQALGPKNVLAMILPYCTSNPDSEAHARLVIEKLGLKTARFDITGMVQAIEERFPEIGGASGGVRKGNIMARCRMIALYDQSAQFGGLVMGTSNRTETLLGYFTLYGDGAAAIKPIAHLFKCQVRALARHVGVPEPVIAKAPSADLWAGQTDEGDLGFSYDDADQVLYLATERRMGVEQIAEQGFELATVEAILRRMRATAFKRRPAPVPSTIGA